MSDPIATLIANHRSRHDHTEDLGRCDCGAFLPSDQERVVCGNCGTPQRQYLG